MDLPLNKKLKKREYINKGILQDQLIAIVYSIAPDAILHGGTGIWRCLKGNRFSEDLDFYLIPSKNFEIKFKEQIKNRGFELLKYKTTDNTIFSNISNGSTEVKFEASFQKKKATLTKYELIDGSYIDIYSITPKEYFYEKMQTYTKRKLARDIYDVYFLSDLFELDNKDKEIIIKFLDNIEKPIDEENLKAIVLIGACPTFDNIILKLKRLI